MTEGKVDAEFWLNRWKTGDTGWHQNEVEEELVKHFGSLKPTRVLVPLCGKSLDLAWLASRGHTVLGAEFSEMAIRAFFEEHRIPFTEKISGEHRVFSGGGVSIYQGDFFRLKPDALRPIGAIYDRAALIALPFETRKAYARRLIEFADTGGPDFQMLQLALHREPHDEEGPPFSVPESEIRELYGKRFKIERVGREQVPSDPPGIRYQSVYRLS